VSLARVIDRAPALLVVAALALAAQVALAQDGEPADLLASAPAALLLFAYLRAGRAARGGR
jgi:hypothetical protein